MNKPRKISFALSIASTILLQACSSGDSTNSSPEPVENTAAPQLVGNWITGCVTISSGTSTTTGSSGGGSGSGGVTGGSAFIDTASYRQTGEVQFSKESFSSSNCNANTSSGSSRFDAVYRIGSAAVADDGSDVTGIVYSNATSTTYSIFQIVDETTLYLGDFTASTTLNDGSSENKRLNSLGPRYTKQ